ncbi:protein yippee-like isoform X3 [Primulina tabacum]
MQTYKMISTGFLAKKCSKGKGMQQILHFNVIMWTNIWTVLSCRVNVTVGEKVERMMMTGVHVVADIFCVRCGSMVGWKYEMVYEKNQKYKEGKSVLECFKISGLGGSHYCVSHEAFPGGIDADDI